MCIDYIPSRFGFHQLRQAEEEEATIDGMVEPGLQDVRIVERVGNVAAETQLISWGLPSGKRLHNYGKSPFLMGNSTISMAIFNSYVSLPEGILWIGEYHDRGVWTMIVDRGIIPTYWGLSWGITIFQLSNQDEKWNDGFWLVPDLSGVPGGTWIGWDSHFLGHLTRFPVGDEWIQHEGTGLETFKTCRKPTMKCR